MIRFAAVALAALTLAAPAGAARTSKIVRVTQVDAMVVTTHTSPQTKAGAQVLVDGFLNGHRLLGAVNGSDVLLYGQRVAVTVGKWHYTVASFGGHGRLVLTWETEPKSAVPKPPPVPELPPFDLTKTTLPTWPPT